MKFLDDLAARRRFGMKPGLDAIRGICAALGDPQKGFKAIHVAGTNGKGAVCAILDAALRAKSGRRTEVKGQRIGRYTSPHLVKINERFFLDGAPVEDETLERVASIVKRTIGQSDNRTIQDLTFFEALTAVAFLLYAEAKIDYAILECGLGGRLDATNICDPALSVITRIGLDHCDWLGDTVEKIAAEKAGIVKPGVPVVLGRNEPSIRAVIEAKAREVGAPFHYAPDLADESEIPSSFSLAGAFNRENALTALAVLKVLFPGDRPLESEVLQGFSQILWPGRFQRIDNLIIDGAHNPPAAWALREALEAEDFRHKTLDLICGFCGDKDVDEVLSILSPVVRKGFAVQTNNPRSLSAEETAAKMRAAGIDAEACRSFKDARWKTKDGMTLVCGSLFLAGETLVELGAYPWDASRFDGAELLKV